MIGLLSLSRKAETSEGWGDVTSTEEVAEEGAYSNMSKMQSACSAQERQWHSGRLRCRQPKQREMTHSSCSQQEARDLCPYCLTRRSSF